MVKTPVLCRFGKIDVRGDSSYLEIQYYQRPVPFSVKRDSIRKNLIKSNVPADKLNEELAKHQVTYQDIALEPFYKDGKKGTFCGHFFIKLEEPDSTEGLAEYSRVLGLVRAMYPTAKKAPEVPWFHFLRELVYIDCPNLDAVISLYKANLGKVGSLADYVDRLKHNESYIEFGCFPATIALKRSSGRFMCLKQFNYILRRRPTDKWEDYMGSNILDRLDSVKRFTDKKDAISFADMFDEEPLEVEAEPETSSNTCLAVQQLNEYSNEDIDPDL